MARACSPPPPSMISRPFTWTRASPCRTCTADSWREGWDSNDTRAKLVFLVEAHRMWRRAKGTESLSEIKPMRLFHHSNLYLSLLFVAVAIDPLITR